MRAGALRPPGRPAEPGGGNLITKATRELLDIRSGLLCELCGVRLSTNTHHRRAGGMGGSRHRPGQHDVVNLLRLCGSGNVTGCHGDIESNRDRSYDLGLLVRRTVSNVAAVPVKLCHGWVLLTADGLYSPSQQP